MKKNLNPLFQKSSIIRLILFLTILHGSITSHTQTIGIVQGLVTVSPRQGPPFNGMPTVEFPVETVDPDLHLSTLLIARCKFAIEKSNGCPIFIKINELERHQELFII